VCIKNGCAMPLPDFKWGEIDVDEYIYRNYTYPAIFGHYMTPGGSGGNGGMVEGGKGGWVVASG
jgi:hypothetical protein